MLDEFETVGAPGWGRYVPRGGRAGPEVVMHIGFGVNFMPSAPVLEVVEWARAVERHGYDCSGSPTRSRSAATCT